MWFVILRKSHVYEHNCRKTETVCGLLYLGIEFVTYGYAFSCGIVHTVEYSSTVSKFSYTVQMEYIVKIWE